MSSITTNPIDPLASESRAALSQLLAESEHDDSSSRIKLLTLIVRFLEASTPRRTFIEHMHTNERPSPESPLPEPVAAAARKSQAADANDEGRRACPSCPAESGSSSSPHSEGVSEPLLT